MCCILTGYPLLLALSDLLGPDSDSLILFSLQNKAGCLLSNLHVTHQGREAPREVTHPRSPRQAESCTGVSSAQKTKLFSTTPCLLRYMHESMKHSAWCVIGAQCGPVTLLSPLQSHKARMSHSSQRVMSSQDKASQIV